MNQEYLQLYADFIVKVGVNVRPRQNFIIRCPVTMPEFAHACAKAGYEAGAKEVIVPLGRTSAWHGCGWNTARKPTSAPSSRMSWRSYLDYAEDPDGCCTLAIHAADPEAFAGLDAGKLNRVNLARRTFYEALAGIHDGTTACSGVWPPCPRRPGRPRFSPASRWEEGDGKALGADL